jgi:hypothetical protein
VQNVSAWLPTVILVPLVAFGLYRRYKRTFGLQPLTLRAMLPRMLLLGAVSIFFAFWIPNAMGFGAAAAGAAIASPTPIRDRCRR